MVKESVNIWQIKGKSYFCSYIGNQMYFLINNKALNPYMETRVKEINS